MSVEDIKNKASNVKYRIEKMMKDKQFKKEAKFFDWKCKYSMELNECAGELNLCRQMFSMIAFSAAKDIKQGEDEFRDTSLQEAELKNAFLGYLMMDDALYTLKSINDYDAITSAYESLDRAEKRIKGEKAKKNLGTFFRKPDREGVKATLENEVLDEKREKIYSEVKDELKATGNIEQTLLNYRQRKREEKNGVRQPAARAEASRTETPAVPDKNYESEEERLRRVENERSMSFRTAPPEL